MTKSPGFAESGLQHQHRAGQTPPSGRRGMALGAGASTPSSAPRGSFGYPAYHAINVPKRSAVNGLNSSEGDQIPDLADADFEPVVAVDTRRLIIRDQVLKEMQQIVYDRGMRFGDAGKAMLEAVRYTMASCSCNTVNKSNFGRVDGLLDHATNRGYEIVRVIEALRVVLVLARREMAACINDTTESRKMMDLAEKVIQRTKQEYDDTLARLKVAESAKTLDDRKAVQCAPSTPNQSYLEKSYKSLWDSSMRFKNETDARSMAREQKLTAVQAELSKARDYIQSILSERDDATRKAARLQGELESIAEKSSPAPPNLPPAPPNLPSAPPDSHEFSARIAELEAQLQRANEFVEKLSPRVPELEARLKKSNAKYRASQAQASELERLLVESSNVTTSEKTRVAALERLVLDSDTNTLALKGRIVELERQLIEAKESTFEANVKFVHLQQQLRESSPDVMADKNACIAALESQLIASKADVDRMQRECVMHEKAMQREVESTTKLERLKSRFKQMEKESKRAARETVAREVEKILESMADSDPACALLQKQVNEIALALQNEMRKSQSLQDALNTMKSQRRVLEESATTLTNSFVHLERGNKELRKQLALEQERSRKFMMIAEMKLKQNDELKTNMEAVSDELNEPNELNELRIRARLDMPIRVEEHVTRTPSKTAAAAIARVAALGQFDAADAVGRSGNSKNRTANFQLLHQWNARKARQSSGSPSQIQKRHREPTSIDLASSPVMSEQAEDSDSPLSKTFKRLKKGIPSSPLEPLRGFDDAHVLD